MIEKALQWALHSLRSKTDAMNSPLVLQAIEVGMMGQTDEEKCMGILQQALRANPLLPTELLSDGFSQGFVDTLCLFAGEEESEIVDRILRSGNPLAMQVEANYLLSVQHRSPSQKKIFSPWLMKLYETLGTDVSTDAYFISVPNHTAIFAGGCFWGVQHEFEKEKGVCRTLVGYTGGEEISPSYKQVRDQRTGHVEAVIIEFDPDVISYERLVQIFFEMHDPSQKDGVGPDIGDQYRSVIFYITNEQKKLAQGVINDLQGRGYEVNTLLLPSTTFWVGEKYHQQYYARTGGEPYCHIRQKKF